MVGRRGGQGSRTASDEVIGALLRRIADGDRYAFEELYKRSSAKLFGLCLRILGDRGTAEEVLQDMYIAVWHRAGSYRPDRGSGMTWLLTVAHNRAIDRLRARRPLAGEPLLLADMEPDPAPLALERLHDQEERSRLARCLDALPARDATMIRTAFLEGASYSDLARRADLPLGTVKSRIRRALLRLRECLR